MVKKTYEELELIYQGKHLDIIWTDAWSWISNITQNKFQLLSKKTPLNKDSALFHIKFDP